MADNEARYQAVYSILDRQTGELVVDEKFNTNSPIYLRERLIVADMKTRGLEHGYTESD